MLKLPALRTHLRNLVGDSTAELFESYDLATTALDVFRTETPANAKIIGEYEEMCSALERELSGYCCDGGIPQRDSSSRRGS
ncbi:hypothetical protein [Rhizobium sp. Root1203]|uniref:hypothetical protein n=1 Tax=Rhizobium sp. Root1203 TaxID=1736427 RepID=UPI00191074FB|nr:hypothetical protein [Rhizobium sp. Root1203]